MSEHDIRRALEQLVHNYTARAQGSPQPPAQWADVVRDLNDVLGHGRIVRELDRNGRYLP